MSDSFETVWDTLEKYNSIPSEVTDEVDILHGAAEDFVDAVASVESITDNEARANFALDWIKKNNGPTQFAHADIKAAFKNLKNAPLPFMRQLYMLERSIPARAGLTKEIWTDRIRKFIDTGSLEEACDHTNIPGLSVIRYTKKSGDHTILHAGHGEKFPDFYAWDKANNLPIYVEFKHWGTSDINAAKKFYEDKRYNAPYVIVFTADHYFYLCNYIDGSIIDLPMIQVPQDLLIW